MIIVTRCPYRLSLFGGGSDIDWFLKEEGYGYAIGASLKLFSRVVLDSSPNKKFGILNYISRELYRDISEITHPIIREALKNYSKEKFVELSSFAESFQGSGLGGSSSFTNALLMAIFAEQNIDIEPSVIAKKAAEIEIDKLNHPIGVQDHYLSALGGVSTLKLSKNREIEDIQGISNKAKLKLSNYLEECFLVSTGISRSANYVLEKYKKDKKLVKKSILEIRDIAEKAIEVLTFDDFINEELDNLLKEAWEIKSKMPEVLSSDSKDIETFLYQSGCVWLRLLGAGAGGYFLCKPSNPNYFVEQVSSKFKVLKVGVSSTGVEAIKF